MALLQKMGWRPGEGLGKNKEGTLEPLQLEIKMDKKGEHLCVHVLHFCLPYCLRMYFEVDVQNSTIIALMWFWVTESTVQPTGLLQMFQRSLLPPYSG